MPTTAPYASWASPITSDLIVADSISLLDVLVDGQDIYWVEGRPKEAGRYVLVKWTGRSASDVNPSPFNARSRVHEYGGGGVLVVDGVSYFSHYADQRLYRMEKGKPPAALTPDVGQAKLRYADGRVDPNRGVWVGVREDHRIEGQQAVNSLVAIDLACGGEGIVLHSGYDFYSSPRLSPDGKQLAWLAWNHPNMPWTETELWIADFHGHQLANARRVAGGRGKGKPISIFQPEWSPSGTLYFISDESGWWNLYRLAGDGTSERVVDRAAEFGQPQWIFGMSTYAFVSDREAVCTYIEGGLGKMARLDLKSKTLTPIPLPFTEFAFVRVAGNQLVFRAGAADTPHSIVALDLATNQVTTLKRATTVVDEPELRKYLSKPQPIEFPTANGKTAFGLYYPPVNPEFAAPAGERPPLLVRCHGGPTSAASSTLNLGIQFWTSRGVAVVDVNYGGSTGFGREYRDRLERAWGVVDVEDSAAAVWYLVDQGLADPKRVVISGGSAGGYTVLACLTAADEKIRQTFQGGASHFGISDLEAMAKDTHKFESRYLDGLVGPYPADKAVYEKYSPVHNAARLTVPVAFFQGTEDEIVPPNQTEFMVEALKQKGLPFLYLLFDGEQHGFRQSGNIKRALDGELNFYATLIFRVGLHFLKE